MGVEFNKAFKELGYHDPQIDFGCYLAARAWGAFGGTFAVSTAVMIASGKYYDLRLSAISAGIYIIGSVVDMLSTESTVEVMAELNDKGIAHSFEEKSFFIEDQPQGPREIYSRGKIIADCVATAVSAAIPPLGIGLGSMRFVAAESNMRAKKVLERTNDIASNDSLHR